MPLYHYHCCSASHVGFFEKEMAPQRACKTTPAILKVLSSRSLTSYSQYKIRHSFTHTRWAINVIGSKSRSDARTGFRNRGTTQGKPQAVQDSLICYSHSADDLLAVEDLQFACKLQEVLVDAPLQGNRDSPAAAQAGSVLFAPLTASTFRRCHLSNPMACTKSVHAVHTVSECHAVASHPSAAGVPPCEDEMCWCTEQVFPCTDQVRSSKEPVRSSKEQVRSCTEQMLPWTEQVLPCTE
jgi:hypothetical protein